MTYTKTANCNGCDWMRLLLKILITADGSIEMKREAGEMFVHRVLTIRAAGTLPIIECRKFTVRFSTSLQRVSITISVTKYQYVTIGLALNTTRLPVFITHYKRVFFSGL